MMMNETWFYRVKAAQRDLIKMAGGIERAVTITSMSKSHVGRWNSASDPDLMPISAVLQLEAETGAPLVTQVLAETNGRRVAEASGSCARSGDLLSRYSETIRQAGELMSTGAQAFADGMVTPGEAVAIDRAAAIMQTAISELRRAVASVQVSGGESASIRLVNE